MKHILTLHDGEVRLVGNLGWKPFPASGGQQFKACCWHCQFAKDEDVRKWLLERSRETWTDDDLDYNDYWWCFRKENYETSLLKWIETPASGGTNLQIRTGNLINLAELLHFGNKICTCYDMYCLYLSLPIFIDRKAHSMSQSPQAQQRRNAKILRYSETGYYGLPRASGR